MSVPCCWSSLLQFLEELVRIALSANLSLTVDPLGFGGMKCCLVVLLCFLEERDSRYGRERFHLVAAVAVGKAVVRLEGLETGPLRALPMTQGLEQWWFLLFLPQLSLLLLLTFLEVSFSFLTCRLSYCFLNSFFFFFWSFCFCSSYGPSSSSGLCGCCGLNWNCCFFSFVTTAFWVVLEDLLHSEVDSDFA